MFTTSAAARRWFSIQAGNAPKTLNVTFLGGGKIAQAMIQGLKQQHDQILPKVVIRAVDPNEKRLTELRAKGCEAEPELSEKWAHHTDVLILAVKPQQAGEALKGVTKHPLRKTSLVLSVVAGLTLKKITDFHPGTQSLIRAMPNTPATIGKGITVWISSPETTPDHFDTTKMILRASKLNDISNKRVLTFET